MIGKTVTFDLGFLLLVAAVVLFICAAIPRIARAWLIPVGLACFAGSFLASRF